MKGETQGKMIVIVAPSGSGKSTLIKKLKIEFPGIVESVSCTTRPIRPGEKHGINYYYISREDFEKKIQNNDFLEYATVHSNYYGTSKTFVEEELNHGRSLLFDLDVQGADAMKKYFGTRANIIFIEPPSLEELKKRLYSRGTETPQVIEERLKNAESELKRKNDYTYCVKNDDLERAYQELRTIFESILSSSLTK